MEFRQKYIWDSEDNLCVGWASMCLSKLPGVTMSPSGEWDCTWASWRWWWGSWRRWWWSWWRWWWSLVWWVWLHLGIVVIMVRRGWVWAIKVLRMTRWQEQGRWQGGGWWQQAPCPPHHSPPRCARPLRSSPLASRRPEVPGLVLPLGLKFYFFIFVFLTVLSLYLP